MDFFDPTGADFWATVGTAVLCGGIIGCERQLRGKPAGIRTSILVCLSTAVFMELSGSNLGDVGDPTRVLGQIVTGVGFLGGGVIISQGGVVAGVTTAAVVWVLAAIGAVIGMGHEPTAVTLSIVTVAILVGVEWLEPTIVRLSRRQRDNP